jgi:phosphoribosylglycinamide formyltransferase-1
MTQRKKIGVLISGRGSNLKSLIEAAQHKKFPAEIVVVISNQADVGGLNHARKADIPALVVDHTAFETREDFEDKLDEALREYDVELVCNAGFMRLLTEHFVAKWLNRQINIHPSLLPSYKGLHTHERVLKDGIKITGCSVHFVRTDMDSGPIIAQAAVPVLADDTPDTLAARVLEAEHKLYPHALGLVAGGQVRLLAEQVIIEGDDQASSPLFAPPL